MRTAAQCRRQVCRTTLTAGLVRAPPFHFVHLTPEVVDRLTDRFRVALITGILEAFVQKPNSDQEPGPLQPHLRHNKRLRGRGNGTEGLTRRACERIAQCDRGRNFLNFTGRIKPSVIQGSDQALAVSTLRYPSISWRSAKLNACDRAGKSVIAIDRD